VQIHKALKKANL